LEGELPDNATEILVTEKYLNESGKKVGDKIFIEEKISTDEDEEEEASFVYHYYWISGVAIDALDINSTEGAVAFRNNATTDYIFYVTKEAVMEDIYTAMYLTLEDTDELACYTDAYEQKVDEIVKILEGEPLTFAHTQKPGTVLSADKRGIAVACEKDAFFIKRLQFTGGKPLTAADAVNGRKVALGNVFGKES